MKAFSLSLLAIFCVVSVGFAQQQKVSGKAVIKTPTVQCDKCKDRIEFFIAREYGLSSVKVNIKQKTTTVTWLNDRTTLENIKVAIANLGFDADDIEAEESAYKRLPKECKLHNERLSSPPSPVKQ
ncbi:MAG TPA: heavy-metal-associated domain-containing protein [Ferruginibacter sp.]|nr:heavy-metal-associated domain-containing protein [Ferruginibacter sp.]